MVQSTGPMKNFMALVQAHWGSVDVRYVSLELFKIDTKW